MKNYIVVFVASLLVLCLAGCSGGAPAQSSKTSTMEDTAVQTIVIDIEGTLFTATLYDNETVDAFIELLPFTLTMGDFNQNEKVAALPQSLPTDAHNPGTIRIGDLMLYGSGSLVLFYDTFPTSYSYTPIGTIDDISSLVEIVGSGSIEAAFSIGG